jgi:hypothetical protein
MLKEEVLAQVKRGLVLRRSQNAHADAKFSLIDPLQKGPDSNPLVSASIVRELVLDGSIEEHQPGIFSSR